MGHVITKVTASPNGVGAVTKTTCTVDTDCSTVKAGVSALILAIKTGAAAS